MPKSCRSGRRPNQPWRRAWSSIAIASGVLVAPAATREHVVAEVPADHVELDSDRDDSGALSGSLDVTSRGGSGLSADRDESWRPVGSEVVLEKYADLTDRFQWGDVVMSGDGGRVAVSFAPSRNIFDPDCNLFGQRTIQVREWDGNAWAPLGSEIRTVWGDRLALSADGNRLVVGAPGDVECISGKVYVYDLKDGSWVRSATIAPDENSENNFFGSSVAVSADGRVVAVGAPDLVGQAFVRVFGQDETSAAWMQLGDDLVHSVDHGWYGREVALSAEGTRLAVSDPAFDRTFAGDEGLVRAFDWNGSSWNQVGGDIVGLVKRDEQGGRGVDISAAGDRIGVSREQSGPVVVEWTGVEWRQVGGVAGWMLSADGTRTLHGDQLLEWIMSAWVPVGGPVENVAAWSDSLDRVVSIRRGPVQWCVFELDATVSPADGRPARCRFSDLQSLVPARVLESRVGEAFTTVDGVSEGVGRRPARSVTEVQVAGRGGVPEDASGVMLNVTAVAPSAPGHVTVYGCGEPLPLASNLNYNVDQVIANSVFTRVGVDGKVCIYTHAATDLVVDVSAYERAVRGGVTGPKRLLDSRVGDAYSTVKGGSQGIGRRPTGSTTEIEITTFAGEGVTAAWLNVTAVQPDEPGHVTVFPCDEPRPVASNLNYVAGDVIANSVFTRVAVGGDGNVCIYTHAATDLVVDFAGATFGVSGIRGLAPARVFESRVGEAYTTVDGVSEGVGRRPARSVTEVQVAGRGGVFEDASGVMLNVTAVAPSAPGHVTVYACGEPLPLASNLNYNVDQVIANSVFTGVGVDGKVCIYTHAATDLIVDISGYVS